MILKDDRTPQQKITHTVLIGGIDSCLSGWGGAEGGLSRAYWACPPEQADTVEAWVESRGDIRKVTRRDKPSTDAKHVHIYVVTPTHPALAALADKSQLGADKDA